MYYIFLVCGCNLSYPARKSHPSCYIVICGRPGCIVFFHMISQTARFSEGGGGVTKPKIRVLIFPYNFCRKHLRHLLITLFIDDPLHTFC
jgi:hypothetical protein